ncbi:hypothetical protein BDN72DRAFT_899287 [Pluteus cervinus]|uniref:Uncharacterized protein n=1 Tax=Pluteus cervinus TaxID=181527 RepID=A0ACD3AMX9_9AGAR|nr:hypothetical protein BDN72DRAFT_899287 [Pluteus cervinus]
MAICLKDVPRISTFRIAHSDMLSSEVEMSLNPLWDISAPLLVELSLHRQTVPPYLTLDAFPALNSLSLALCEFDWACLPIGAELKTLLVTNPKSRTSVEYMLDKLGILEPTLESLALGPALRKTVSVPDRKILPSEHRKLQYSISNSRKLCPCRYLYFEPPFTALTRPCYRSQWI